jgi:eukaryotic-like serine/threonine-protein kinase
MTTTVSSCGGPVRDDRGWAAGPMWQGSFAPPAGPAETDGLSTGMPDCLVADYVVERTLGHGSLGRMLLARSRLSGRLVVIKILADHLAGEEMLRARFLRAADLGMRLSHPNVVRVFEAALGRSPYVVTEYIEGETLAERLQRSGPVPGAEATRLAIHLAAGLAHAHASGVVHGALAPHRILLGADDVARIDDYGFARLLAPGRAGSPSSATTCPSSARHHEAHAPAGGQAQDVYDLAMVLRQVGDDRLPPGLTALVDAGSAHPSVRPSVFDVLHELHTMTSAPGVWLPSADASGWSAASHPDVTDATAATGMMPTTAALDGAVASPAG